MEFFIVPLFALGASLLTFFSGFGLGTLLMPILAIFFPLPVAIMLTAIVHLLNNLFKLALVAKNIDRNILFSFGIPALLGAWFGSMVLVKWASDKTLFQYELAGTQHEITLLKLPLRVLMCFILRS